MEDLLAEGRDVVSVAGFQDGIPDCDGILLADPNLVAEISGIACTGDNAGLFRYYRPDKIEILEFADGFAQLSENVQGVRPLQGQNTVFL